MTQLTHLLFPSPAGNYLVANQSMDVIAKTSLDLIYQAFWELVNNSKVTVWDLVGILLSKDLSPKAKEIIKNKHTHFLY
jgi:hypothetical protein